MTPSTHLISKVVLIDVVSPGTGVQPPGTQGIVTVMGYVAWVVCALCVTGVLLVAGRMAKRRGLAPRGWRLQTFVGGFPSLFSLRRAARPV